MEIEIKSKKNNPLLNRTEVQFVVKHTGEKTPGRDIIRNDLAEKLNAKKENVLVHRIKTGFGSAETVGYAKVYSSLDKTKSLERKYVKKRNNVTGGTIKTEKKTEEKPEEKPKEEPSEEKSEDKPKEEETKKEEEKKTEEKPEEKPKEEAESSEEQEGKKE